MRITDVSPQSIVARQPGGEKQVYLRTPIGWRRRTDRLADDGDLVTDPALNALLDNAASEAD